MNSIENIKKYIDEVNRNLFETIKTHCFYITIDKAHENNTSNELSTNNVMLQNFIIWGYSVEQIIAIGRLIDGNPKSKGLNNIISMMRCIDSIDAGKLDSLCDIIKNDQNILDIKYYRDKKIAHYDIKFDNEKANLTLINIENALITIAYVAKELSYIISQTVETFSWYPGPGNNTVFKNLDKPFFFPDEIDKLTNHFLELQEKMDKNIRDFKP